MNSFLWSKWFRGLRSRPETPRRRPAPRGTRLVVEVLEDRTVPAQFNVAAGDVAGLIADIKTANSNGDASNVINLAAGSSYKLTAVDNFWYGPNGLPPITSNLTIHGNGATIARSLFPASPAMRLFYVSGGMELPAGALTMDNVTLEEGRADGGSSNRGGGGLGAGGAIFNQGTLNLTAVTMAFNVAQGGSSGVSSLGNGGGGMGQDAPVGGGGGGFGGSVGTFGGTGAAGSGNAGGGGGGFLATDNGGGSSAVLGGGKGGFAQSGEDGGEGAVGPLVNGASGSGGNFGSGGDAAGLGGGSGGGGVGGGGGSGVYGGSGGFGGGGGASSEIDGGTGVGGFGGGAGLNGGRGGFGGGPSGASSGGGGAGLGGAIFNMGAYPGSGQATLVNCTLYKDQAYGGSAADPTSDGAAFGGAIFNLDGTVTLINDTIDAGIAANGGGAVYNLAFGNDISTGGTVSASLVLNNSILANAGTGEVVGFPPGGLVSDAVNGLGTNTATVSGSHNLVMTSNGTIGAGVITMTADPRLGPLQNNGGLTPTMLPQSGSPVLGAGDPNLAPPTDQRGQPRTTNAPTDLGSVQVTQPPPSPPSSPPPGSPPPSSPSPPPPSLLQALISLYIDGIELEAMDQGNLAAFKGDLNLAGELGRVLTFFGSPSLAQIEASIAFNEPFTGPFGPLVVQAGQHALDQALQQMSASS